MDALYLVKNKNDANVMLSYLKDKDDIVYVMQGCYIRLNRELSKEEMDSLNHNNIYLKRINIEISPDKLNSKFISIIDNMSAFYNRENDVCCYFDLSDNKEIHYVQYVTLNPSDGFLIEDDGSEIEIAECLFEYPFEDLDTIYEKRDEMKHNSFMVHIYVDPDFSNYNYYLAFEPEMDVEAYRYVNISDFISSELKEWLNGVLKDDVEDLLLCKKDYKTITYAARPIDGGWECCKKAEFRNALK